MKINTLLLLTLLLVLAVLPAVSAQPPAFQVTNPNMEIAAIFPSTHQEGKDFTFHAHAINLTNPAQSFLTNETTTCYIHIYNLSNGGEHIIEDIMSFSDNGIDFEYTVSGNNFVKGMIIQTSILCNTSIMADQTIGETQITYSGGNKELSETIFYVFSITIMMALFILTIMAYLRLPKNNPRDDYGQLLSISHLKYLRIPMIGMAWFIFLAINFIISGIARDYFTESSITNIFFALFTIQMRMTIPFIILIFLYLLIEIFKDKELNNLMKRGLPTR